MKIPTVVDLRKQGAKQFVQDIIDTYGMAKHVTEVGLRVDCKDDAGKAFQLYQFNSSRHLVTIGAVALVS